MRHRAAAAAAGRLEEDRPSCGDMDLSGRFPIGQDQRLQLRSMWTLVSSI